MMEDSQMEFIKRIESQPAFIGDLENQMTGVPASVHNEAGSSQSGTGGAQQPLPPTSITLEELGDINRRWMEDAKAKRQLPRSSMSLQELKVKNRLLIKENPNKLFRESYYMWKETDDFFVVRAEKKNQKIGSLYNEIYQLIGFFSVFQGVILIACAQSNLLTCHNWWTTFFLSLLASLVTIFGVIQKFRTILTLKETIQTEDDSRKVFQLLYLCSTPPSSTVL